MLKNKEQPGPTPEEQEADWLYEIASLPFGKKDAELRDNPNYSFTRITKETPIDYRHNAPHISKEFIDFLINKSGTELNLHNFRGNIMEITVYLGGSNIFIGLENENHDKLNLHFQSDPPFEIYTSYTK